MLTAQKMIQMHNARLLPLAEEGLRKFEKFLDFGIAKAFEIKKKEIIGSSTLASFTVYFDPNYITEYFKEAPAEISTEEQLLRLRCFLFDYPRHPEFTTHVEKHLFIRGWRTNVTICTRNQFIIFDVFPAEFSWWEKLCFFFRRQK